MKKVLCTLVLLTVMSVSAWADDFANSPKTYAMINLAISPTAEYNGEASDETVLGFGVLAGYHFTENLAVEGAILVNNYKSVPYSRYSSYKLQLTGLDVKLGGVFVYPINSFRPYAGAGVMYSSISLDLAHNTAAIVSTLDSDRGFGVYGKAGVKYDIGGYQGRYIIDLGAEYASRFMDKDLQTFSVSVGIGYKF